MARQNIKPNPSEKLFEAYMDFSGGLNSETSNEKLKDNEYPIMENVDLSGRGSAKRRTGRSSFGSIAGNGQGIFSYYRQGQSDPDIIVAVSGKLYVRSNGSSTFTQINITDGGSAFTFQTTLPVQAVQFGEDLFVATGTKLVEVKYNGSAWVATIVTPYSPTVMEAIYIGTNGLASNPNAYVQDGTGTLEVVGIKPDKRTGTVNIGMNMTAYINKAVTTDTIDYKWEYKMSVDTTWTQINDFTASKKTVEFKVDKAGSYDIRCTVRKNGTTTPTPTYSLTSFIVNQVESKTNTDLPVTGIQKCRKIVLHWDRLILAGDDTNPYQAYISDLNNPRYFPVTNTIKFDTGKQEPITAIVRYQDMLVFFTKTTIQTLTGKSTMDYSRNLIHDGIGCVAGETAKVAGNHIIFLSDEGLHLLKPNYFKLESMNVQRIDYPIKSEITPDTNACAMTYDSQYWIAYPNRNILYRLYYDNGMWVKDKSSKLNIVQFMQYGNDIYNLTKDGNIYKHDETVYNDVGEVYEMKIETKMLDLSASFNMKKLKRIYILFGSEPNQNVNLKLWVYADSAKIVSPEIPGQAVVNADGTTTWTSSSEQPNLKFYSGTTFGTWLMGLSPFGDVDITVDERSIRGKCRRVKIIYSHTEDQICEIFGLGLEFKMKKP